MPAPVNMVDTFGEVHAVDPADVKARRGEGWTIETIEGASERVGSEAEAKAYSGVGEGVDAFLAAQARGVSGGLSDIAISEIGGDSAKRYLRKLKEHRPNISTAGEVVGTIGGTISGAGPIGGASKLGARVAARGQGALGRVLSGAGGAAIEGAAIEVGAGISDLALSEDPVTMDRIAGDLSHRFFYGGLAGGAGGAALRGLEVGLSGARNRLVKAQAAAKRAADVPEDLASLDRKGLRAAHDAEIEAIEAARVPERAKLADEIRAAREAAKVDQPWLAVASGEAGAKAPRWQREIGKVAFEADRSMDRLLRNPKMLAQKPGVALSSLQQQEHALELILQRTDDLKAMHAADRTGARAAAFEKVGATLERNRALQQRITDLGTAASSPRLKAITDAQDMLANGASGGKGNLGTLAENMASGAIFSVVAGTVGGSGLPGAEYLAPFLGAGAAGAMRGKLGAQLAATNRKALERTTQAVDAFLAGTKKAQPYAPILATKVLERTRFASGPEESDEGGPYRKKGKRDLEDLFDARASEIARQIQPDPATGKPRIRSGARTEIAQRLSPLAAVAPHVADKMETHAVARLEFLASKIPPSTQIGMTRARPPEMAIRAWARYVAAADDPGGIEERLADGTVTPEDREVMQTLYPDRMAEITRMIAERLPELRATLPYHRRLALSIFTGEPVDAAMEPRILRVLQDSYAQEEGTEMGTQAPRPQPAFGSVQKSAPTPTPAQARAG